MTIRRATKNDLPELERVYAAAREYMKKNGNPTQWRDSYPPRELIEKDIDERALYVLTEKGEVRAAFVFVFGEDKTYKVIADGEWKNALPYHAVHRVASDGTLRGVGRAIFDYCKERADNIKIDTHRNNLTMQSLLQKNGFSYCGIIFTESGYERFAFQYTK